MNALLVVLSLLQQPGRTTFDTKLDLTTDPAAFLARSVHLWNPQASFGELQNQAYGYLFPQGTWFWIGDLLGAPDWVVQRLWSALLLVVAYEGSRRVYRAVQVGAGTAAQVAAGLGFALAPRLLGLDGVLTGEVLPTAVLPWVVLPLLHARHGRLPPRTAALLSGCAVLCMGGVNAVENLAALPLPFLVLLAGLRTTGGKQLLGWWTAAVSAASLWWLLPLFVFGRYSPPFLDYIETAEATTKYLGWTNATRGADHWVGFITVGGRPWWPAMHFLSTHWFGIAITAVVAGLGVAGLAHRAMPIRTPLLLSMLLGLLCLTLAHGGALGSPLAEPVRSLLDGALAPLRNVHKVDPLIRLPLALGLAHLVTCLAGLRLRAPTRRRRQRFSLVVPEHAVRSMTVSVVLVVLVASAAPLLGGMMRKPGYDRIPQAWYDAAEYVEAHHGTGRVLVLPGTGFAEQVWGSTIDEPIQAISEVPWVTRSQVPLAPGPTIRMLGAIEERIADGVGSPALGDLLARSGVSLVLVRRDLDLTVSDAPGPQRVDTALSRSPGLRSVASFGQAAFGLAPLIEVYEVESATGLVVDATPLDDLATLAGDPGDVLDALEAGLVDPERPVTMDGVDAPQVQSDGYRRIERQFGRVHDATSQLMSPDDVARVNRDVLDYPGPPGQSRMVEHHDSVLSMRASSSAGYVDTLGAAVPERGPYSAVDGSERSFWQSAPARDPEDAWLELTLREPSAVGRIDIITGNGAAGVPIREIEVRAGDQTRLTAVDPVTGRASVVFGGETVERVRVAVSETLGEPDSGVVAIKEISFDGLFTSDTAQLPDVGAGAGTSFVLTARPPRTACVEGPLGAVCDGLSVREGEAEVRMSRELTLGSGGSWRMSGTVVSRATRSSRALTEPLGSAVRVRSRSVYADDLLVNPQNALDADPSTWWLSAPGDGAPTLHLRWGQPRTLSRLVVQAAPNAGSASVALLESGDGQERVVPLGQSALGYFEPLRTRRLDITFDRSGQAADARPIGVAELRLTGLDDLRYQQRDDAETGALCGLGPPLQVDGRTIPTRVVGTAEQLETGAPMELVSCGGPVRMAAGQHRIDVLATGQFAPVSLELTSTDRPRLPATGSRATEVLSWDTARREVEIGPGEASVLRVAENVNDGWQATLDGQLLETMSVDGWQQGYVVPAGVGGTVVLTFVPDRWFRTALALGGISALLLVVGALVSLLAGRRRPTVKPDDEQSSPASRAPADRPRRVLQVLLVLLGGLLGGIGVAVGVAVGVLTTARLRKARWLPAIAGGLVALAGLVAAAAALAGKGTPWTADLLAALAVGVVVALACLPASPRAGDRHG